jgi:hypothetical protein
MVPRALLARSPQALLPLLPLLLLPACGEPQVSAPPPDDAVPHIAGTYRVEGITTVIGTELSREISGTVILAQEGGEYTATFDLATNYPGPDGALPAEVVGTGEGRIQGSSLKGTASTQIVASRVPGLDPGFTLVPPSFGVRVVSTAEGTVQGDGTLAFQLENRGAEGEDYVPTRTTVTGVRIE